MSAPGNQYLWPGTHFLLILFNPIHFRSPINMPLLRLLKPTSIFPISVVHLKCPNHLYQYLETFHIIYIVCVFSSYIIPHNGVNNGCESSVQKKACYPR